MPALIPVLKHATAQALQAVYGLSLSANEVTVQPTRKEFEGDFTIVLFPFTRHKIGSPEEIGTKLGDYLVANEPMFSSYNLIKGFLNLTLADTFWRSFTAGSLSDTGFFLTEQGKGQKVVVEYCSPNTNKPLHLGHLRNIVLGDSLSRVLAANGFDVHPTCLFNDRGSNISKSMYGWKMYGNGETPENSGRKGDKIIGDAYVAFSKLVKQQIEELVNQGLTKEEAEKQAPANQAIHDMTVRWEQNDPEVRALWQQLNTWVYDAFEDTFRKLGIAFEKYYYESEVYLRGKETVAEGLNKGVFYQTEDGSIVCDLTDAGLDKKQMLRSNGTSLYITQDLAVAEEKFNQFGMDRSIYVVGNEQDYHFKVLFEVLKRLEVPYANGLFHLSYGMVNLPTGKMKSREGTTVEADDLLEELLTEVRKQSEELGKTEGMSDAEKAALHLTLALGALKFFLVKVDPKKAMVFNPAESIDLQGHTGPFIQYTYARINSLQNLGKEIPAFTPAETEEPIHEFERVLLQMLARYPEVLADAGREYNPALIANYAYDLAKEFNRFYQQVPILKGAAPATSAWRLALTRLTGTAIREAMGLLGIQVPERM